MDFTKFNKTSNKFDVTTDGRKFEKLSNLFNADNNKVYCLKGFYLNKKSRYGDTYVAMVDDVYLVDLPKHLNETLNNFYNDSEIVKAINNRECFFKIRKYIDKVYKKECYTIEFIAEQLPF